MTSEKVAVAPPRAMEDPPVDSEESDCESEAVLAVTLFPRITTSWSTARLPPPVPVLRFLLEGWALQMKNDESVFKFFLILCLNLIYMESNLDNDYICKIKNIIYLLQVVKYFNFANII